MNLIIQSYSTNGLRDKNEDAMELINNLDHKDSTKIPILYVGVFDGHGGDGISKALVDENKLNISKYFCKTNSPITSQITSKKTNKRISELFIRIQEKLINHNIKSNSMGSTALITLIYPRNQQNDKFQLKVINLGDCRAVSCSSYNIGIQLTLDHKPHLFCEKNRIAQMGGVLEKADGDDYRIDGMSVSRSFGDLDNRFISQNPDIFDYVLSNEKFLIMGCDGVWDVLTNQEAVDFVLEKYEELKASNKTLCETKKKSALNLAQKLADYAIFKGSTDNISLTIIFFMDNLI